MSFGEIFLILFVILLFFGSKSIPKMARTLGRAMREVKSATNDIQREIRDSANDIQQDLDIKGRIENSFKESDRRPGVEQVQSQPVQEEAPAEMRTEPVPQAESKSQERPIPKVQPPKNSQPRSMDQPLDQDSDSQTA